MRDVMILTGAGQIGMAIARRIGYGKNCYWGQEYGERSGHRQNHERGGI